MKVETRFITDDELQQRYGEKGRDFLTFHDDLSGKMVKIHYLKSDPVKLDLIFSACLPVDANGELFDPVKPSQYEKQEWRDHEIKMFTLTGGYCRSTSELHLTATNPKSMLKVYEIKRIDGKDVSARTTGGAVVTNGKIEFTATQPSDDKKAMMVYVMATATKQLEDLAIKLEV